MSDSEVLRTAILVEPQYGLTYEGLVAAAQATERAGIETFFRSDHFSDFADGSSASTDAWTTIAGLASRTTTVRLGTLVSPVGFRPPGLLAKIVATVDEMSAGRVEVGIGTGWYEPEHVRHGFPFPSLARRLDALEDSLEVLTRLWGPDGADYDGHAVSLRQTVFQPKPIQRPHPPIIVGGTGGPRSAGLAVRFADEYDLLAVSPEATGRVVAALDAACRRAGRDPATLGVSVMALTIVGRDADEVRERVHRAQAIVPSLGSDEEVLAHGAEDWLIGTADVVGERLRSYARHGVDRIVFQILDARDLGLIALLGDWFGQPMGRRKEYGA